MKQFLINLLFRLLNQQPMKLQNVAYLFGVTSGFGARKLRWEKALARLWKDKDLLDYLMYQSESDKEKAWQGKISKELSQGARIRTLFIVYSARRAYENSLKRKASVDENEETDKEIVKVGKMYSDIVAVK